MRTDRDTYYDDDVATERAGGWNMNMLFRLIAVVAAGVMTVIGLIAVAKVSWGDNGFDAAPVDVAGMSFTPEVAVTIAGAGIIALIAAAVADRASKLVVGALLFCGGVVILATDTASELDWRFDDGMGWLAIGVGATLVAMAVLMYATWSTGRRHVRHRRPVAY